MQNTPRFLGKVWLLSREFWTEKQNFHKFLLLGAILAMKGSATFACIWQNEWYNHFYGAISSKNSFEFLRQVEIFGVIGTIITICLTLGHYASEGLKLTWRNWMVDQYASNWLSRGKFYGIEQLDGRQNPDQRIAEDIGSFVSRCVDIIIGFADVLVSTVCFSTILYRLSGSLNVGSFSIPGYMLIAALFWAFSASWVANKIGKPLQSLYTQRALQEADLRYSLVRIRENAEAIALYRGEVTETKSILSKWNDVLATFWTTIKAERNLGFFTNFYGQFGIIISFLLISPRYFAGLITFGDVMQTAAAFGAVQACINFFITNFTQISYWKADTDRLIHFERALGTEDSSNIYHETHCNGLRIDQMKISLPSGRNLFENLNVTVDKGEAVLFQGPSGTGKSTLMRVLAGLWSDASGNVCFPSNAMFIPQKAYIPDGDLITAAFYPNPVGDETRLVELLNQFDLEHLVPELHTKDRWSARLSGGEQQRIGVIRALLSRPEIVFLDESTSALDAAMEHKVYTTLRNNEWGMTIISIGHRDTLAKLHDRVVNL